MSDDKRIPNETTVRALEESRRLLRLLAKMQDISEQQEPDSKQNQKEMDSSQ